MSRMCSKVIKKSEAKKEKPTSHIRKSDKTHSARLPFDHILFLQRTIGNHAVTRLFKSGVLQSKLRLGTPGDVYEQEADRVAEQVMRVPMASKSTAISVKAVPNPVWLRCSECTGGRLSNEDTLRPKKILRSTQNSTSELESDINAVRNSGQSLPGPVRAFFEPRFGYDFGHVRIHADAGAAKVARAVNARAFTLGRDVVFGEGEYKPETSEGRKLIAHELTHVKQQSAWSTEVRYALPVASSENAYGLQSNTLAKAGTGVPEAGTDFTRRPSNCKGWESDPESFSKFVSEYYVRTELNPSLAGTVNSIECYSGNKICHVHFSTGITVGVSFVKIPDFVIVRRIGPLGPRCEYDYDCSPSGELLLKKRKCELK